MTTTNSDDKNDSDESTDYCPLVADQDPEWVDDNLLSTRYEH